MSFLKTCFKPYWPVLSRLAPEICASPSTGLAKLLFIDKNILQNNKTSVSLQLLSGNFSRKGFLMAALKPSKPASLHRWAFFFRIGIIFFCIAHIIGLLCAWFDCPVWVLQGNYFSCGAIYSGMCSRFYQPDQRMLGFVVDGLGTTLLVFVLWLVIRLSYVIEEGNLFTLPSYALIKRIVRLFLLWALYAPIRYTLLTLIQTMHNPVGERLFTVTVGMDNLMHLIIWCGLALTAFAIHQGISLYEDYTLTV